MFGRKRKPPAVCDTQHADKVDWAGIGETTQELLAIAFKAPWIRRSSEATAHVALALELVTTANTYMARRPAKALLRMAAAIKRFQRRGC